jgi:hypothetical protein
MATGGAGRNKKGRPAPSAARQEEAPPPTLEDVFNRRVEELLEKRGLKQPDLLALLEEAGYTPEVPASVLLNDALAIAAVLDVSPISLLLPDDETELRITPAVRARPRRIRQWLRGLRPLRDGFEKDFHSLIPLDDLRSELVAENWIRADRVRVAGLVRELEAAISAGDSPRVKLLTDLAATMVDLATLARANEQIEEKVTQQQLDAARIKGIRYRRQRQNLRQEP